MKIEILLYVYLAVCAGMILFNIVSAVLSRLRDKRISKINKHFNEKILNELGYLAQNGDIHNIHKRYLSKKLKRIGNMRSFDIILESEYTKNTELVKKYLHSLNGVFVSLAISYCKKEAIEAAFFPYIIKKYRILQGHSFDSMTDMLYVLLTEPSIEQNYFENVRISEYAEELGMSESNFRKLFKERLGMSPIEYRNLIRIREAQKMILSGECTVQEAAYLAGFNNMSFFYETYKKQYGTGKIK